MDEKDLAPLLFHPPEFLYKYRHLQGDHREWTKKIITHSEVYFSRPTDFNDPFDCKADKNYFEINTLKGKKELKDMTRRGIKTRHPDMNREERRKIEKIELKKNKSINLPPLQELINDIGVFSLAEENNNILLWSHYADGHKGLCLKFYSKYFFKKFPMIYTNKRPKGGILKSKSERFDDIFRVKAEGWAYEKEWRTLDFSKNIPGEGYGTKPFSKESLVGIIFGCEMPDDDKKEIVELVKDRPTLKLQQAEMTPGKFALTIKPYKH